MCASTVASSRSTCSRRWMQRTALEQRLARRDVADLLVVREPVPELVVERLLGALADAGDARADRVERAHELALVRGKARLDEDDVHGTPRRIHAGLRG